MGRDEIFAILTASALCAVLLIRLVRGWLNAEEENPHRFHPFWITWAMVVVSFIVLWNVLRLILEWMYAFLIPS